MKKFIITLMIVCLAIGSIFALDTTKLSVGASFGTTARAVNLLGRGDYEKVNVRYSGFTMDVRGDYEISEDFTAVAILSWDIPSTVVMRAKVDFFAHYAEVFKVNSTNHYLGLYAGASYNILKSGKFVLNVAVGPEFDLNLNTGKFDGLVAGVVKASYGVTDKITVDVSVRGAVVYLLNGDIVKSTDEYDMFASTNKVVVGATYSF